MRTIADISDVHFGREDPAIVEGLLEAVAAAGPDVVVVSGDLTQRARKRQFRAARAFLEDLPEVPRIVIPGNHDIALAGIPNRGIRPFRRFKPYITDDLEPFYIDRLCSPIMFRINLRRRETTSTVCGRRSRISSDFSSATGLTARFATTALASWNGCGAGGRSRTTLCHATPKSRNLFDKSA